MEGLWATDESGWVSEWQVRKGDFKESMRKREEKGDGIILSKGWKKGRFGETERWRDWRTVSNMWRKGGIWAVDDSSSERRQQKPWAGETEREREREKCLWKRGRSQEKLK
jgi:hypothetical protein